LVPILSQWRSSARLPISPDAEAAAPNLDNMIEHNAALAFPIVMSSSLVRGIDTPALAFSQTIDALGVMC
jgi:hypothetical protein